MRVTIYARVSTDEQKQGRTIDSQIKELERYAQAKGYAVVDRYIDDGWSGSLLSRPALDRLRDDAARSGFEAVLLADVDRLSRDLANLAVVKRALESKGVTLIFQKLPSDGSPLSNFMVNILGSFAEFERTLIADRTRRGRRFKVQERQLIMGNLPPYGYTYVKKDRQQGVEGHYEISPEEARIVRIIYSWVNDEGLSQRGVTRKLNELRIPPRQGKVWSRSTVHRVLTNETYAGITHYNKHRFARGSPRPDDRRYLVPRNSRVRPRSEWIPIPLPSHLYIIGRIAYERVQERLGQNRMLSSRNVKFFYLLRKVRRVCGRCGAAYVGTPYHGRPFYRCSRRDGAGSGEERCRAKIVSARKIETAVWRTVEAAVLNPELILDQVNRLHAQRISQRAMRGKEITDLRQSLMALSQEEERVLLAYRTGITHLEQFGKEMKKITERRTYLERLLQDAERQAPPPPPEHVVRNDIHHWSGVVRGRIKTFSGEERQSFLGYLLSQITIDGNLVKIRGEIPAGAPSSGSGAVPAAIKGRVQRPTKGGAVPTAIEGRVQHVTPSEAAWSLPPSRRKMPDSGVRCGRNPTWPFEFVLNLEPGRPLVQEAAGQKAA